MRTLWRSIACALLLVLGAAPAAQAQSPSLQPDGQGGYFDANHCHYVSGNGTYDRDYCLQYASDGTSVTRVVERGGRWVAEYTIALNDPAWFYVTFVNGQRWAISRTDQRHIMVQTPQGWAHLSPTLAPPLPRNFDPQVTDPQGAAQFGQVGDSIAKIPGAWTKPPPESPSGHHH